MTRRYTYETNIEVSSGDDCGPDFDVKVSFVVIPGEPETGPSYACGGAPANPAEIDDIRLETVNGKPRPWGMYDGWIKDEDAEFEATIVSLLENGDRHWGAMMQEVAEADEADRDAAAEARWEPRA
jgi:hypothetical protein